MFTPSSGVLSAAVAALAALLAVVSLLDAGHVVALIQAGAPTAGALLVLAALLALLRRRFAAAAVTFVSAVVLVVPAVSVPRDGVERGSETLSVLASNSYNGEIDAAQVMAEVRARDVDVLVVPEMSDAYWAELQARGLLDALPHVTGRTGGGRGMLLATREPFTCVEIPSEGECGRVLTGDDVLPLSVDETGRQTFDQIVVDLADGTRLKGVHLWSPRMPPFGRWHEQQGQMAAWIEEQDAERPLVLAGDFNAGPSHPAFRAYSAGFEDSPRGEWPWTATWPKLGPFGPLTHIDHVLARGWQVAESETVAIPGSDHRAVWTLLTR